MNNKQKYRIELEILRQNPTEGITPYWQKFEVKTTKDQRILDLLLKIRRTRAPGLGFRASCKSGQCGADAMNINGENRLACQTLLSDLGTPNRVTIRPLNGYQVEKDLIVNLDKIKEAGAEARPTNGTVEEKNTTAKNFNRAREAAICNLCGICDSACPVTWENENFPGPAKLLKYYRYFQVATEKQQKTARAELNQKSSIWSCETDYNCLEACPREINITAIISRLKGEVV